MSTATPASDSAPSAPPACSICGRQDKTVRLVGYPFVLSLLIVTYRRTMAGIWCSTHRNQRLVLSSLITATIGWLGIPFGFIYTPITLFKLARGGIMPEKENAEILTQIAAAKLQRGDYQSAVRCLEASLRFQDSDAVRQQLRQIRSRYGLTIKGPGCIGTVLAFAAALIGAGAIGGTVGLGEYFVGTISSRMLTGSVSVYIAILTWVPFVVMAFWGSLFLFALVEWTLVRVRCKVPFLAITLALLAGSFAAYSVLQGMMVGGFLEYAIINTSFKTASEAIVTGLVTLVIGGALFFPKLFRFTNLSDIIFLILFATIVLYYVTFAIARARETVRWQQRIAGSETVLTGLVRPATF